MTGCATVGRRTGSGRSSGWGHDLGAEMQLYLIRHAHALDAPDDFSRPLSSRGRAQVESLARHCRAHDLLHPAEVWHSPLLRARQTAQGLAAALGWKVLFQETDLLEP